MKLGKALLESLQRRVLVAPLALLVTFGIWNLCYPGSTSSVGASSLKGDAALQLLKEQGLYDSLREAVKAAAYNVREDREKRGLWRSSNEANGLRAEFNSEGVRVEVTGSAGQLHRVGLTLRGIGYGKRALAIAPTGSITGKQNRIEITRSMAGAQVTEWYTNTVAGLEQGFTVGASPGARRQGERLRLVMKLESDLRVKPGNSGQVVELENRRGESVLRYEKLVVADSQGRKLAAEMGAGPGELWLEVDDSEAVYPVTIDPILTQGAYLKASNTDAEDMFGASVATSGDTVVVGAPDERSNATGVNGNQADNSAPRAGAAYVFVRSGGVWIQQAYLKASNTGAQDMFGSSVAVSGDTLVVGAPGEDSNATGINGNASDNSASSSGAAYVFVQAGGVWSQQAYLKASNTEANDLFGYSVSVSGGTVVVGAPAEDSNAMGVNGNASDNSASASGAGYVFTRSGVVWSQQAYLKASNTQAGDAFGWSVTVSGDTLVVGAPTEDSNATGVNGNQSDNSALESGAAYAFMRSGGAWSQQAYLKASNTQAGDKFGSSVAVFNDTTVVGAPFEASNATGVNGNQSDNSAPESGAAYVFVLSGGVWSQQAYLKASNTGSFDSFGGSVAASGDIVVVGAHIESSNATGVDGNQSDNSALESGAAYVFVRSGGVWNQQAYLKASNAGQFDRFGYSVGVAGTTVVVGAPLEDSNATGVNGNQANNLADDSGAAYVFVPNIGPSITAVPISRSPGEPPANSTIAIVSDPNQPANTLIVTVNGALSATVNGVTVSNILNVMGVVKADVVAACGASNANFTLKVTNSAGEMATDTLRVLVSDTTPPTLILKPSIQLWPPNHKYHTVTISQMVASASDLCNPGVTINDVKIQEVTSNEPDNGQGDGNTTSDIVIGANCQSVQLRSERDGGSNGRVYSITLRLTDAAGNSTRKVFKVTVSKSMGRGRFAHDITAQTVRSNCP